ncbi:MAG: acetyl ornithine aminotransferase family protein [Deltaproteobacteria bacterium]|nr:MAG: acetyl ornithine aminotransferase family protein [Deltaproteobacteria bacterium]
MSNEPYPKMVTSLPGPAAKAVLAKDDRYISPSYTRGYPLVIDRGRDVVVTDVDGNRFLDFTSGIAVCNTGHAHPEVVKAIIDQAEKFLHMSGTDFYYAAQSELAEKLARISPGERDRRVFYSNSGAESIEAALKLVRYHTRRTRVISFFGSFHGRTMGALSLSASKSIHEKGFAPMVPGITHVPYAYCYRCPYHLTYPQCNTSCVDWIREDLFKRALPPEEVAAIFVEPIQGEGGYIVPPKSFHQKLKELCDDYGILYVADEIQTGMGRTGKMFACDHFGIDPDIFTIAKGIASGMPLGAMLARHDIMDWVPGSHASTFGGNPISCRAALVTIDLLTGGLVKNAAVTGAYFKEELVKMAGTHRLIGDVRGVGLMVAIELVTDREKKTKAVKERNRVVELAFRKGLLLLGCGENSVRFIPALTVSRKDIGIALSILDEVLTEVEG